MILKLLFIFEGFETSDSHKEIFNKIQSTVFVFLSEFTFPDKKNKYKGETRSKLALKGTVSLLPRIA